MGNPPQSLRALIRSANYLLWTVVSLSLRFDMYMFASLKQDLDYISHILFQVNLNEATVVYLLRRRPKACLLKHLFSPPWTTFSTETSLVFSRRRPQTRPRRSVYRRQSAECLTKLPNLPGKVPLSLSRFSFCCFLSQHISIMATIQSVYCIYIQR